MAWKAVHEQSPVGDFLDMFSHRLTQFVWHIWRKYRYHISFRNGGVDVFRSACTPLSGWATASFAISWRLITAKCWRIPGSLQTRAIPGNYLWPGVPLL
ncbi:type VI secretion system baseplate subunit TssG [Escherichia coli]